MGPKDIITKARTRRMATISECRYRWLRESSKAERAGEVWVGLV
jgi:hypothetical protein